MVFTTSTIVCESTLSTIGQSAQIGIKPKWNDMYHKFFNNIVILPALILMGLITHTTHAQILTRAAIPQNRSQHLTSYLEFKMAILLSGSNSHSAAFH